MRLYNPKTICKQFNSSKAIIGLNLSLVEKAIRAKKKKQSSSVEMKNKVEYYREKEKISDSPCLHSQCRLVRWFCVASGISIYLRLLAEMRY